MSKKLMMLTAGMLLFAATASADLVPIGDPVEGQSWTQQFAENGIGSFDLVAVSIVSGGPFENATHSAFSDSTWSLAYEDVLPNPTLASAWGSSVTSLTWTIKFTGSSSSPLTFDYVAFDGDDIANSARICWNGSIWSVTQPSTDWLPDRVDVIPAPGAVVLGLIGLGAVARIRRYLG